MADVSASPKVYTIEDLQQHKTREDCWVLISGKVYNVTKFLDEVSSTQFTELLEVPGWPTSSLSPTVPFSPSASSAPHHTPSRSARRSDEHAVERQRRLPAARQ